MRGVFASSLKYPSREKGLGMLKEFKEFAMKGNLVDMAVGFVMGGAFATVVTAFIQGVFLPLLAPIMGGIDLSAIAYTISPAELNEAGEVVKEAAVVELGNFIAAVISFIMSSEGGTRNTSGALKSCTLSETGTGTFSAGTRRETAAVAH